MERRKRTGMEAGAERAVMRVLEVRCGRERDVARDSSSEWYWTFSETRGS